MRGKTPVSTWTINEVAAWATAAVDGSVAAKLEANEIDGASLLDLTEQNVAEDLECDCPQQRATIMKLIHDMCEKANEDKAVASSLPYYIPRAMPASDSPDPRRQTEELLSELAKQVQQHPTVPITGITENTIHDVLSADMALELPPKHCSFASCNWTGDTDEELLTHLKAEHLSVMQHVLEAKTDQATMDEQTWAVYNNAIEKVCQQAAPTASYSIDRRALRSYSTATSGHNIQELICFCCARRFPYTTSWGAKQFIKWVCASPLASAAKVANETPFVEFLGLPYDKAHSILGLQTYLDRYGACGDGSPDLTQQLHEFDDWTVGVPFENGVLRLLCCPEDRRCDQSRCQEGTLVCRACQIPVCVECLGSLTGNARMPPAALTNDMMVFYAPRELYVDKVTVMEMLCASVCITTMVCFTLEAKYRKENPFDQEVHMARHRMGARGNVTFSAALAGPAARARASL